MILNWKYKTGITIKVYVGYAKPSSKAYGFYILLSKSKTRSTSFYKKRKLLKETMLTDVNKVMKTKC